MEQQVPDRRMMNNLMHTIERMKKKRQHMLFKKMIAKSPHEARKHHRHLWAIDTEITILRNTLKEI